MTLDGPDPFPGMLRASWIDLLTLPAHGHPDSIRQPHVAERVILR